MPKIHDSEFKKFLREHRTYVYRDNIRVYPYGDFDNDWLKLDIYRGLVKASYYLSNDQLIGYVNITAEKNEQLRDKTNREGLLEQGTAYEDFRLLILSALNSLNTEFYKARIRTPKPKHKKDRKNDLYLQSELVNKRINKLETHLEQTKDVAGKKLLTTLNKDYLKEQNIVSRQINLVEDLAGVGIAVDATSHDIRVMVDRAYETSSDLISFTNAKKPDIDKIKNCAIHLQEQVMLVKSLLEGIQPLFRSARRRKKQLNITEIIKKVEGYFKKPLKAHNINVEYEIIGVPLIIPSNEGILLQLFINLFDNSAYWIQTNNVANPEIRILVDGDNGYVVFSDNGPGVDKDNVDYIFEPFFSTKGIEGRGLGLFIARQLTDKYEYDLYYLDNKDRMALSGANFKIDFIEQEA